MPGSAAQRQMWQTQREALGPGTVAASSQALEFTLGLDHRRELPDSGVSQSQNLRTPM